MFKRILKAANSAYENGDACLNDSTLAAGERGDTLADFIVHELRSVCAGLPPKEQAMTGYRAIRKARIELQKIESALNELTNVKIVEEKW